MKKILFIQLLLLKANSFASNKPDLYKHTQSKEKSEMESKKNLEDTPDNESEKAFKKWKEGRPDCQESYTNRKNCCDNCINDCIEPILECPIHTCLLCCCACFGSISSLIYDALAKKNN